MADGSVVSRGRPLGTSPRAIAAHGGAGMSSRVPRGGAVLAAIFAVSSAAAGVLPASVAVAAGPDPIVDVEPDVLTVQAGDTVTLTARIYDTDGVTLLTGPSSNTQVRFDFLPGSPNDPGGSSSDLQCHTGHAGECSVSYVATVAGIDEICARTTGGSGTCDEPVGAPERVDAWDTVRRVVGGPNPSPKLRSRSDADAFADAQRPTPTPTPAPRRRNPRPRRPQPRSRRRAAVPTPSPTPEPTATLRPRPSRRRPQRRRRRRPPAPRRADPDAHADGAARRRPPSPRRRRRRPRRPRPTPDRLRPTPTADAGAHPEPTPAPTATSEPAPSRPTAHAGAHGHA